MSNCVIMKECFGDRFIGAGEKEKEIVIHGVPGNALGCYLNGASIEVHGNVQDAVGDTMNDGKIIVHGNAGDALGYAMRGGEIYIEGNTGYRTGIHMKEYGEKKPLIVVGGGTGSFLGEYLAGGMIIVLGLTDRENVLSNFTGTGMHGGVIYVRTNDFNYDLPEQVAVSKATKEDIEKITKHVEKYAELFNKDAKVIMDSDYYVLKPNAKNPYKAMYVAN